MKKLMFMLLLAGSIQAMYAQKFSPNTPLFEELTDVKKKTDKFNLYLNMQGSFDAHFQNGFQEGCLLYTSPSPRDRQKSRMPSSA